MRLAGWTCPRGIWQHEAVGGRDLDLACVLINAFDLVPHQVVVVELFLGEAQKWEVLGLVPAQSVGLLGRVNRDGIPAVMTRLDRHRGPPLGILPVAPLDP